MTLPPIFSHDYYAYWRDFEARHWWTAGMRDVASMLIDLTSPRQTGTMLDVGCGSGQGMHWWTRHHPQWGMVGVDLGMDGLQAAVKSGLPGVTLATATSLPIASKSVDLIITLDVLQHLPLDGGDRLAFREMHRVLKPGGHLFIRTNAQSIPRVPDDREAVWHKYDPDELEAKLRDEGFTIVRLSRINAVLGLAEIPRELRRLRESQRHSSYDVVSKTVTTAPPAVTAVKRGMLKLEGRMVRAGLRLLTGRSLVALCRRD